MTQLTTYLNDICMSSITRTDLQSRLIAYYGVKNVYTYGLIQKMLNAGLLVLSTEDMLSLPKALPIITDKQFRNLLTYPKWYRLIVEYCNDHLNRYIYRYDLCRLCNGTTIDKYRILLTKHGKLKATDACGLYYVQTTINIYDMPWKMHKRFPKA